MLRLPSDTIAPASRMDRLWRLALVCRLRHPDVISMTIINAWLVHGLH